MNIHKDEDPSICRTFENEGARRGVVCLITACISGDFSMMTAEGDFCCAPFGGLLLAFTARQWATTTFRAE